MTHDKTTMAVAIVCWLPLLVGLLQTGRLVLVVCATEGQLLFMSV